MLLEAKEIMASIEEIVQIKKMTYIDAIMEYCDENKMEPEVAGNLVGKGKLKQKIQEEAENLNYYEK